MAYPLRCLCTDFIPCLGKQVPAASPMRLEARPEPLDAWPKRLDHDGLVHTPFTPRLNLARRSVMHLFGSLFLIETYFLLLPYGRYD